MNNEMCGSSRVCGVRPRGRFLNGPLEYRLIEMVPAAFAGHVVPIHAGRGKDPLPAQLA